MPRQVPHFGGASRSKNLDRITWTKRPSNHAFGLATCSSRIEVGDMKPYAVYLLERFKAGETPEELALREGIPIERITIRLAVAAEFVRKRPANVYRFPTPHSQLEVAA